VLTSAFDAGVGWAGNGNGDFSRGEDVTASAVGAGDDGVCSPCCSCCCVDIVAGWILGSAMLSGIDRPTRIKSRDGSRWFRYGTRREQRCKATLHDL